MLKKSGYTKGKTIFRIQTDNLQAIIKQKGLKVKLTDEIAEHIGSHMETDWLQIELMLEDYKK